MAHSAVHALTPVIAKLLTCLAAVGGRRLGRAPAHTTCISVRRRALFLACFYASIHRDPQIADLYEDEAFKLDVVHGKHPFFIYYDSDGASAPGRKACRRCVHCDGSAQLSGSLPDPGRGARGVRCVYAPPPDFDSIASAGVEIERISCSEKTSDELVAELAAHGIHQTAARQKSDEL